MAVRLKQLRPSRAQLRCTRAGARALIYPKGPHEQALFDFVKWCAAEPGYTVVAVHAPRKTAPEALEDVLEDLAACPGVLRLIPATSGSDTTLEFGSWLAQRLGRIVVAHEGKVTIVPGGGLYIPPGETGGAGWLRFEPGGTPVAHSRRFPRPGWDCEPFAEPHALGPHTTVEPLPAGVWIRPVGESPEVDAFRSWLLGGMAPDPLLPRVVLGYPGSPAPPIEAVAEFWRSLPGVLQPAVRFSGFGGTDEGSVSYGQQLADALDAPVVLGNGVQLAEPSATGGYEMRTVLRQGVMSWPPYVGDLGYLPARSTSGIPADPVAIGHRAPIIGLQEREPGVYEYGQDAVLEVTQSGLWVRPPVLPSDSFSVRTEQADPAHATVVFDASSGASAHRMQLLATEMVQRLEPRVRSTARILASSSTGSLLRDKVTMRVAVMDRPQEAGAAPEASRAPTANGVAPGESVLNLAALTGDAAQAPAPRPVGIDPADLAAGATLHIPIETLLASLTAGAGGGGLAGPNGVPADGSSWLEDFDDAPVPPAIALYALAWDPDAEDAEPGADLVSRTVAEARNTQPAAPVSLVIDDAPAQTFQPVVEAAIPLVSDAVAEVGPALGTLDASGVRPVLISGSAVLADPVVELEPIVITGSPVTGAPIAAAHHPATFTSAPVDAAPAPFTTPADAPAQFTTGPVDAPSTQLTSGRLDAVPSQFSQSPLDAPPAQFTSGPVDVPPVQFTPGPAAAPPAQFTSGRVDAPPAQFNPGPVGAPPAQPAPSSVDAPPTQLASDPFDAAASQFTPGPVDAPPAPPTQLTPAPADAAPAQPAPAAAPAAQFTVARRRLRKGRTTPAAPAAPSGTDTGPQDTNVLDASAQAPGTPTSAAPTSTPIANGLAPAAAPTNNAPPPAAQTVPSQTTVTQIPAEFVPNAVPAVVQPVQPAPAPAPVLTPTPAPVPAAQTPAAPQPQVPTAPQASTPVVQAPVAPQASTAPAPTPVMQTPAAPQAPAAPPIPQPVEEPDEPIQYGAFQLFSSSSDPSLSTPSAPAAPAPQRQRPVVPPTPPAADQAPPATPVAPPAPQAPASTGPATPPSAPPIGNAPVAPVPPMPSPQNQAPVAPAPQRVQPQPLPLPVQQPSAPAVQAPLPAAQPLAPAAVPAAPAPAAPAPAPAAPIQPQPPLIETALPAPIATPAAQPANGAPAQPATNAAAPAKRRPARPAKSTVRVQPVPAAQCSVIPREGGLAKERDWLRRNLSKQYDAAASSVARILSEYPGLRAGSSASDIEVLTDLVALRLYLTGKISGLDAAVRAGQVGPHVPLARCVASGLRRLPSYRGPLRTRVALTTEQVQWYGNRSLVTEWSFLPAVASPALDLPGSAEILIWSMTGRRTGLFDPSRPDQVVFQPGTSFKVLSVGTGQYGPELALRELTRTEVAPDGTVQSIPALDEFAAAALEETGKAWRRVDPVEALPADRRDWFASPPGLLAPGAPAGPAGGAKEGGKA